MNNININIPKSDFSGMESINHTINLFHPISFDMQFSCNNHEFSDSMELFTGCSRSLRHLCSLPFSVPRSDDHHCHWRLGSYEL